MPDPNADPVSTGILVQNGAPGAYADPESTVTHRTFFEKGISDPSGDPVSNGIPVEKGVSVFFVLKRLSLALSRCTALISKESASPVDTHRFRWFQLHL